jgi:hypothetical protein
MAQFPEKRCYFQGCGEKAVGREHIPPKAFFLPDRRVQLLTVPSCAKHNNDKSIDDIYALAQILLCVSPEGRARELFARRVVPQLPYNNYALQKLLSDKRIPLQFGAYAYRIDTSRLDIFFTSLACGLVAKINGQQLPEEYRISHIYHDLSCSPFEKTVSAIDQQIAMFYSGHPPKFMRFGDPKTCSEDVYNVKIFGIPDYQSSITVVHCFYGKFKVTSMLSRILSREDATGIGILETSN